MKNLQVASHLTVKYPMIFPTLRSWDDNHYNHLGPIGYPITNEEYIKADTMKLKDELFSVYTMQIHIPK